MLPHSYTVDSLSQSQDLASTVLSSSSPSQISAACSSIESFLRSHSPDQSRHFFSITFPAIICKLFGFDDATSPPKPGSSNGWIDTVSASDDLDFATRVFSLLAPGSILMNSISAVDRHSLVKFVFPIERLPEWTRFMLSSVKDCRVLSDMCPLFKGKVKEDSIKGSLYQIQLNVFEYYMFWFAYYPVCRGNSENLASVSVKRSKKFRLENWAYSIPVFSGAKRELQRKSEYNLYLRLLYAYLREFVPIHDLIAHQPYRSSLLHYSSGYDGSVIVRGEFLVDTLVHYWLVDNDFSPLAVNVCKSFGVSFPFRSVLGETPPTSRLGEVVKLFVKYVNLSSVPTPSGSEKLEYDESPRWRVSGSFDTVKSRDISVLSVDSWNLWIQRPLYRFILRTFLFCPVGSSISNASQIFSVWINHMEPWMVSLDDFLELDTTKSRSSDRMRKEDSQGQASGYSALWQGYVLSNYLYYSSLVMHFIGFAHKFLHTDPEVMVQMVLKVLNVLTSSKELINLIKNVDAVFHCKQSTSGKSVTNRLYRFVPSIREQLLDWEDGLCESDADGSFLHENWNRDLQLFSDGEDGGQQLLQLFILRAEAEFQAAFGDRLAQNLQYIDSLKAKVSSLFGGHTIKPISFSLETGECQQPNEGIFKPRRAGNPALADIKYKGDWMKRPISTDEVSWLAKLLIWLSVWLNESLGLNQPENGGEGPKWSYIDLSNNVGNVCGPLVTMKAVLCAVSAWLLGWGMVIVGSMRRHGVRVNLRILASKKVVMVFFVFTVISVLRKVCRLFS